jgi:hypothetical protein
MLSNYKKVENDLENLNQIKTEITIQKESCDQIKKIDGDKTKDLEQLIVDIEKKLTDATDNLENIFGALVKSFDKIWSQQQQDIKNAINEGELLSLKNDLSQKKNDCITIGFDYTKDAYYKHDRKLVRIKEDLKLPEDPFQSYSHFKPLLNESLYMASGVDPVRSRYGVGQLLDLDKNQYDNDEIIDKLYSSLKKVDDITDESYSVKQLTENSREGTIRKDSEDLQDPYSGEMSNPTPFLILNDGQVLQCTF